MGWSVGWTGAMDWGTGVQGRWDWDEPVGLDLLWEHREQEMLVVRLLCVLIFLKWLPNGLLPFCIAYMSNTNWTWFYLFFFCHLCEVTKEWAWICDTWAVIKVHFVKFPKNQSKYYAKNVYVLVKVHPPRLFIWNNTYSV